MADAFLKSAELTPRDCELDTQNAPTSFKATGCSEQRQIPVKKAHTGNYQSSQLCDILAENPAGSSTAIDNPPGVGQDSELAQLMQQNSDTHLLMAEMSQSISSLGATLTALLTSKCLPSQASATITRTQYEAEREEGEVTEPRAERADHSESAVMEELFDDADSSAPTTDLDSADEPCNLLDTLLQDYGNEDIPGPPIQPKLAEAMNNMMFKKMPEEKLKEKLSDYKSPQNCELLKVSKVNPEIWDKLTSQERSNDLRIQKLQNPVIRATVPLLNIASEMLKVKNKEMSVQQLDIKSLAKQATDAISLLAHVNTEFNYRRRDMLRPHLNKQFQQLCSPQTPMSTMLFGDNLSETIKSMSMTNRLAQQVTYNRQRPAPYHKPSSFNKARTYTNGRHHGNQARGKGFLDRGRPYHKRRPEGWRH